ncbi:poly [ADP-ribose] polymerase 14-like [Ctenocephalides felis]|uniref:poly [ADP-ribose] polymerase 14-like n=1 Tax=Ctenocephalides felis TaxID=7515 RepID=UPI000E6E4DBB|nr:poly [ADP-ribose] polymerase 14-like [Ctenocephalides felis]
MGNSPTSQRRATSQSRRISQESRITNTNPIMTNNDEREQFPAGNGNTNNLSGKETDNLQINKNYKHNLNNGPSKTVGSPSAVDSWCLVYSKCNDPEIPSNINMDFANINPTTNLSEATSPPNIVPTNNVLDNELSDKDQSFEDDEIQLIPSVLSTDETENWLPMMLQTKILYVPIQNGTKSYEYVAEKFYGTAVKQNFKIEKIELIQNPVAFGKYLLKKQELQSRYGNVAEELLFHGSSVGNILSICNNNFNWRLCINSKYGHGISFSPISTYACYSCEKTPYKQMLACLVLVAKECVGVTGMQLPDLIEDGLWCDTAIKNDESKSVVVKFSDHEFYPLYRITFTGFVKQNNALVRRR